MSKAANAFLNAALAIAFASILSAVACACESAHWMTGNRLDASMMALEDDSPGLVGLLDPIAAALGLRPSEIAARDEKLVLSEEDERVDADLDLLPSGDGAAILGGLAVLYGAVWLYVRTLPAPPPPPPPVDLCYFDWRRPRHRRHH